MPQPEQLNYTTDGQTTVTVLHTVLYDEYSGHGLGTRLTRCVIGYVRDQNARFYDLIAAVGRLTGVPVVLNTSFNENEPIVLRPAEALDCFLRTRMDVLVMGHHVLVKPESIG